MAVAFVLFGCRPAGRLRPQKGNSACGRLTRVAGRYYGNTRMPVITFKVTSEEAREIRAAARRARRSVSAHVRAELLGKKTRRPLLRMEKHPVSGGWYNAAGKNLPRVTLEDIKESLRDFP